MKSKNEICLILKKTCFEIKKKKSLKLIIMY